MEIAPLPLESWSRNSQGSTLNVKCETWLWSYPCCGVARDGFLYLQTLDMIQGRIFNLAFLLEILILLMIGKCQCCCASWDPAHHHPTNNSKGKHWNRRQKEGSRFKNLLDVAKNATHGNILCSERNNFKNVWSRKLVLGRWNVLWDVSKVW